MLSEPRSGHLPSFSTRSETDSQKRDLVCVMEELTPNIVRLAYRLILGREPESEDVVAWSLGYGTLDRLRAAFLASDEFRGLVQHHPAPAMVPLDVPAIEVEVTAESDLAAALLAHVEQTWNRLGQEQPHWSILSADQFKPDRIAEHEDDFYASGAADTNMLLAVLRRNGFARARFCWSMDAAWAGSQPIWPEPFLVSSPAMSRRAISCRPNKLSLRPG